MVLVTAAGWGGEAAVKFLLQQRQPAGSAPTNFSCGRTSTSAIAFGSTPLLRSLDFCGGARGMAELGSPSVVRLLFDAGVDPTSVFSIANAGGVNTHGTALDDTNQHLHEKKLRGMELTEEQLHRLEAIRRLLSRVEAVRAASWLWCRDVPSIAHQNRTARVSSNGRAQLTAILPIMRGRRSGTLLVPLLRWAGKVC